MKIGDIAKQSGFTKDTLRYYEKIGIIQLSDVQRSESNYRIYDGTILQELSNIKKLKESGFTLAEIKRFQKMNKMELLNCANLAPVINDKIEQIEQQIIQLRKQKNKLLSLKSACQGDCVIAWKQS